MDTLKVEGHENLVRDRYSKAILNTDRKALEEYLKQREFAKKEMNENKKDIMTNLFIIVAIVVLILLLYKIVSKR